MRKPYILGVGALIVIGIIARSGLSGGQAHAPSQAVLQTQKNSITARPVATATSTASNTQVAEDIVPGLYPNPIKNTSTQQGITVASILVENNTDVAGNPVSDHLAFTLQNLTGQTLSNFEAYYSIVDAANGKKEGYYKLLTGFSLSPHGLGTINFDGQSGPGHYGVNMHGIYGTTVDKLEFKVEVSVPGYAPVFATATKAPGGAEVVGQ